MKKLSLAILCFGAAASLLAQGPQMAVPTVGVAKVTVAKNIERRRYTGVVVSPQTVALVPRVAAEIFEVGFAEGGIVTNNQLLYRLDDTRYVAAVKAIEAQIAATKAHLAYAEKNYERLSTLYKKNVSSMDEMDSALSDRDAYRATILQLEANLITAKNDLEYTRILSPITGKIGFNHFTKGNYLTQSSGTLSTIVQLDPIRVRFAISNRDYMELFGNEKTLKQEAKVYLTQADGKAYKHEGKVAFVDNSANRSTDTVQVYAEVANPEYTLLPNSTLTVQMVKRTAEDCTAIQPSAAIRDAKGVYVWVVDASGNAEQRRVVLGNTEPDLQYVLSGLKAGETVVVEGTHKVMAGKPVKTLDEGTGVRASGEPAAKQPAGK